MIQNRIASHSRLPIFRMAEVFLKDAGNGPIAMSGAPPSPGTRKRGTCLRVSETQAGVHGRSTLAADAVSNSAWCR